MRTLLLVILSCYSTTLWSQYTVQVRLAALGVERIDSDDEAGDEETNDDLIGDEDEFRWTINAELLLEGSTIGTREVCAAQAMAVPGNPEQFLWPIDQLEELEGTEELGFGPGGMFEISELECLATQQFGIFLALEGWEVDSPGTSCTPDGNDDRQVAGDIQVDFLDTIPPNVWHPIGIEGRDHVFVDL
ncbi:MAG: hypothetical protein AAF597_02770, partial [Bacteroidota bacterium]